MITFYDTYFPHTLCTVLKLQNFSITQILNKTNSGEI